MKNFNKFLAGTCALALIMSVAGCAKSEVPSETSTDNSNVEITVAVDMTDVTTVSDVVTEAADDELPVTNEKGEKTVDGATFETFYGSQLGSYLNHQYYYDDVAIPVAEANFYFVHQFTDLSRQAYIYGYYPLTSEGFVDLAYVFTNGQLETFSFDTFGDYFREYAENQIFSTYIVLDMAAEEGVVLPDETYAEIDNYVAAVTDIATSFGLTLDEYLHVIYGPSMNEPDFRDVLERYYLSTLYTELYIQNYEFTEEELYIPKVCHSLFMAMEGVASEEEMTIALEGAEAMLAECTSPDDIVQMGNTLFASGTVAECAEYTVQKGLFVPEFENWAYDPERQVGDMGIVQTSYGYHVMGYLGLEEIDDDAKTNIALQALNDTIGEIAFSDVHKFYTPDEIIDPEPVVPTDDTEITVATSEVNPSMNLDEDGNIIIDQPAATEETTIPVTSVDSSSSSKPKNTTAIIAIVAGVIALGGAGCLAVTSMKGKKNDSKDENSGDSEE